MPTCPANPAQGLIERLFGVVDCHIRVIAHDSYRDLVGPGTLFANVFTVLLTIYIALIGYQLMIGRGGLRLAQMPVEALKIGLILAFTTSWATYQTLVYDLFFDGPRQILGVLLNSSGQDGVSDLYLGLQNTYERLTAAAAAFGAQASPSANILQGGPMLGSGLLWLSAVAMLLSTVGLILAAKIILGFLLALGPIFVGLFLFDATRGFFDGWLRAVVAFALAPLAASLFGAGLVLMIEPFLTVVADLAAQRRFDMGAVIAIVLVVAVFVVVMLQVLRISTQVANGYRSPRSGRAPAPNAALRESAAASERHSDGADRTGAAVSTLVERASAPIDRRIAAAAESMAAPDRDGARLGQSYRRLPRPTRRPGEET